MRLISAFTESKILNELKQKVADLVLVSDKQLKDLKYYDKISTILNKKIQELNRENKTLKEDNEVLKREKNQLSELCSKKTQDLDAYPQITKALYAEIDMQKEENTKLKQKIELMEMEKQKLQEDFKISETVRRSVLKELNSVYAKEDSEKVHAEFSK